MHPPETSFAEPPAKQLCMARGIDRETVTGPGPTLWRLLFAFTTHSGVRFRVLDPLLVVVLRLSC